MPRTTDRSSRRRGSAATSTRTTVAGTNPAAAVGSSSMELELTIWREACRHLNIEESLARMFPILARWLPVSTVAVARLDQPRSRLDVLAISGKPLPAKAPYVAELDADALDEATALFQPPTVRLGSFDPEAPLFARDDGGRRALIVPLLHETAPAGWLLLFTERAFSDAHRVAAESLREPFAVALENDRRVHELARLREAAEAENRALLTRLGRQSIVETIVGEGAGLRLVMQRVEQVAPTDVPVLILGETGSGKEVIARAIHERSPRRDGPIVRVNCGAIPSELVDSELFGHERGSFTGAVAARKGWFERADGGTLFLDEVGELPLAAQVRLLRILQDGTLERVGGQRTIRVDVRIVAATHRDLHQMVDERRFREDLWYRISVFPLRLPSLRERREDIPKLAAHFAARAGERLVGQPLTPTTEDVDLLLGYDWPGNVRELAAVIERAAILGRGRRLDVAGALGAGARSTASTALLRLSAGHTAEGSTDVVPKEAQPSDALVADAASQDDLTTLTLDYVVTRHLERVLARTGGRIEGPRGAAAILDINPHTLRARMRKMHLDWARFRRRA